METNGVLSCISKSMAMQLRRVTIALDEAAPGIMLCPVFGPRCKKVRDKLDRAQGRAALMVGDWNKWHARRCWGTWVCLAWRMEDELLPSIS